MVHKWKPCIKGDYKNYEVSICHTSFNHGFISYGWYGKCKILISSTGPYYGPRPKSWHTARKELFKHLKNVAKEMANTMNSINPGPLT